MNDKDFASYGEYLCNYGIPYSEYEPMSSHTTFRIGGPARFFVTPKDDLQLLRAFKGAKNYGIKTFVIGKGSNLLFDDEGYDGAVITTLSLDTISVGDNLISCFAGVSVTALSRFAMENSLKGLSFAYGIPGSVGGAVYMNAGAYNGEIRDVLIGSCYLDLTDGETKVLRAQEHKFGYRYSSYKDHPERIITSAAFKLETGDREEIKAEMDDFMERRRTKQPLEFPSAGSVFKRHPGRYTAQMIDEAGLKGACIGGAEVSVKHAGFIINKGGATCADVLKLIDLIKNTILERFGIEIECEVIHVKK